MLSLLIHCFLPHLAESWVQNSIDIIDSSVLEGCMEWVEGMNVGWHGSVYLLMLHKFGRVEKSL